MPNFLRTLAWAPLALLAAVPAHASCGATSCNLLNDRFALGTWDHTGWSLDLRLEAIDQDQLREGSRRISPADLPEDEEAVERHTRHRSLVTTIDYAANAQWSFTLRLPLLHRDHLHDLIDEDTGELGERERWRYTRVGDVQALARWQAPAEGADFRWAVIGGLKLPTGSHRVSNGKGVGDGAEAERALQPGTGTTDAIVGLSARQVLGLSDALNLQLTWTQAVAEADGFKPGRRLDASVGWAHAMSPQWSLMLQANYSQRGRDSGAEAEPELSGGSALNLSPGISLSWGPADALYATLQVPVYQKVNGIQLTPSNSLALGWTHSF